LSRDNEIEHSSLDPRPLKVVQATVRIGFFAKKEDSNRPGTAHKNLVGQKQMATTKAQRCDAELLSVQ
jgi:hypothetical protein